MKRVIAALLAALFTALAAAGGETARSSQNERKEALRLHVIANSDSYEDQRIKLLVRDAVLERANGLAAAEDPAQAKTMLLSMGGELLSAAEEVLFEEGAHYGVTLQAGEFEFPERTYGSETYPAGQYEALRITLGSGSGRNWWCVMFPPLCVIDAGAPAEYDEGGRLVFKSFIAELWGRIFG